MPPQVNPRSSFSTATKAAARARRSSSCTTIWNSQGEPVLLVRDPGTTRVGEMIRHILLDPANTDMAMRCEMLLYMAARAQMMHELIHAGS